MTDVKENAVFKKLQDTQGSMSRFRAYDGQVHTHRGERGKQLVEGLTIRDISDCYVRAVISSASHVVDDKIYAEACKGEQGEVRRGHLYGFNLDAVDPVAIEQNMCCEIEKMMGIFPNIDKEGF